MIIKNKSKKTIISSTAVVARTISEKILGLISHSLPATLILHTRFGIHTFFMSYPIDVLILSRDQKVVKIVKSLKPNNILLWNPSFSTVIELPQGTTDAVNIELGDLLQFI